MGKTFDTHGEMVSWYTPKGGVSLAKLSAALEANGMDKAEAGESSLVTYFKRAVASLEEDRTIDKVSNGGSTVRFQFTRIHATTVKGEERLDFRFEAVLVVDCERGVVTCEADPRLAQYAQDLLDATMGLRNTADLTRMLKRLFRKNADICDVGQKGAVYFVPREHKAYVERISALLQSIGGRLERFPVAAGTPEGDASVAHVVEADLQAQLDELQEHVKSWGKGTRSDSLENAMKRWNELRLRLEARIHYLGGSALKAKKALEAAQEALKQGMGVVLKAKQEKAS